MARRSGARHGVRRHWRAPVFAAALVVSLVLVTRTQWARRNESSPTAVPAPPPHALPSPVKASPAASSISAKPSAAPTSPHSQTRSRLDAAVSTLRRIVHHYTPGSVSVAAYDMASGHEVEAGATRGMLTASLVKVEFLVTLLLRHQQAGTELTEGEQSEAQEMIENSDNGAADAIYWDDNAGVGLVAAERRLGLSRIRTKPRGDDFWGLSTTSAPEQIALLKDLVMPSSPLTRAHRRYALDLMSNVEADERWGVPAVADANSTYAVKNGWLAIADDGDR